MKKLWLFMMVLLIGGCTKSGTYRFVWIEESGERHEKSARITVG